MSVLPLSPFCRCMTASRNLKKRNQFLPQHMHRSYPRR
jgi:hypothetical protein